MNFQIISELEKNFGIKKIHANEKKEKIRSDKESYFLATNPKCEPQLGKYNLYKNFGGKYEESEKELKNTIFWILNYSDGIHSLEDIARKSKLDLDLIKKTSSLLESKKLILRN